MINVCALSTGEPKPTASKCGAKVLLFFLTDKHFEDYFIIFLIRQVLLATIVDSCRRTFRVERDFYNQFLSSVSAASSSVLLTTSDSQRRTPSTSLMQAFLSLASNVLRPRLHKVTSRLASI